MTKRSLKRKRRGTAVEERKRKSNILKYNATFQCEGDFNELFVNCRLYFRL